MKNAECRSGRTGDAAPQSPSVLIGAHTAGRNSAWGKLLALSAMAALASLSAGCLFSQCGTSSRGHKNVVELRVEATGLQSEIVSCAATIPFDDAFRSRFISRNVSRPTAEAKECEALVRVLRGGHFELRFVAIAYPAPLLALFLGPWAVPQNAVDFVTGAPCSLTLRRAAGDEIRGELLLREGQSCEIKSPSGRTTRVTVTRIHPPRFGWE